MELQLPYPPTVNTYWRHVGNRVLVSKAGRTYRKAVAGVLAERRAERKCYHSSLTGELEVSIIVYPPDKRRRDLDNICKALLDAMEHAGIYENDNQISRLIVERGGKVDGGGVDVMIQPRTVDRLKESDSE